MQGEELEFLISQYSEGSLSAEQRAEVEKILSSDENARAMLVEYQKLDSVLMQVSPVPMMDYGALRDAIDEDVEAHEREGSASWSLKMRWPVRLAMAAVVAIVVGVGVMIALKQDPGNSAPTVAGRVDISGPSIEKPVGPVVAEVKIVEPDVATLPAYLRYADMEIDRPSAVSIAADVVSKSDSREVH